MAIEISLGDTSAASVTSLASFCALICSTSMLSASNVGLQVAGLARDLLLQLDTDTRQLSVAFGDVEAALVASELLENEVLALEEPLESSALSQNLLLVSSAQVRRLFSASVILCDLLACAFTF